MSQKTARHGLGPVSSLIPATRRQFLTVQLSPMADSDAEAGSPELPSNPTIQNSGQLSLAQSVLMAKKNPFFHHSAR